MSKLFTADWCVNCAPVKKWIEDNNLPVEIVDVDTNTDLVRSSGVRSIPCLVLGNGDLVVGSGEIMKAIKESYGGAIV